MKRFFSFGLILMLSAITLAEQDISDRMKKVAERLIEAINKQDYDATGRDFDQTVEDFFR